jgi:hypothetical protein
MSKAIRFEKFSGACPEEKTQQTAGARITRGSTLTRCYMNQYGVQTTNRLSAPVSAHSLLPKKLQPGILDFVTPKISSNA